MAKYRAFVDMLPWFMGNPKGANGLIIGQSVCIIEFMQKIINLISVGDNFCVLFELKLSVKLNPRLTYHKSSC